MHPKISIIMSTYNRPCLLRNTLVSIFAQHIDVEVIVVDDGDDTRTHAICDLFPTVRYLKTSRSYQPHHGYRNPGPVLNAGVKQSHGDILLMQNAECKHVDERTIERLLSETGKDRAVFARVMALDKDGEEDMCYCGPENPRPFFFCGMLPREVFMDLHGYDEDFTGYGYDDNDLADRLVRAGIHFKFTDVLVHHQWHPHGKGIEQSLAAMQALYVRKQGEEMVRNTSREWGAL